MSHAAQKSISAVIPGFPNYQIDREGRVVGPRGRVKQRIDRNGYLRVQIYDEHGRCRNALLHRLVASAFIPNPEDLPQVNHIDENKQNPCADNLEWCDASHNIRHSRARSGALVDPRGVVHNFECLQEFVEAHGLSQGNISGVLAGKAPHHKGWRTATDETIGVAFERRVRGETPFSIVSSGGEIVHAKDIAKTAQALGLCRSGLSRLISGHLRTHRGWRLWG